MCALFQAVTLGGRKELKEGVVFLEVLPLNSGGDFSGLVLVQYGSVVPCILPHQLLQSCGRVTIMPKGAGFRREYGLDPLRLIPEKLPARDQDVGHGPAFRADVEDQDNRAGEADAGAVNQQGIEGHQAIAQRRGDPHRLQSSYSRLHCFGPQGAVGGSWMASIEAQIIEGGVGDILVLAPKLADGAAWPADLIPLAEGFVHDAHAKDAFGGTGKVSDWSRFQKLVQQYPQNLWILAGGLGPDNIAAAAKSGATFFDLNSGVELAPGLKSVEKLAGVSEVLLKNSQS